MKRKPIRQYITYEGAEIYAHLAAVIHDCLYARSNRRYSYQILALPRDQKCHVPEVSAVIKDVFGSPPPDTLEVLTAILESRWKSWFPGYKAQFDAHILPGDRQPRYKCVDQLPSNLAACISYEEGICESISVEGLCFNSEILRRAIKRYEEYSLIEGESLISQYKLREDSMFCSQLQAGEISDLDLAKQITSDGGFAVFAAGPYTPVSENTSNVVRFESRNHALENDEGSHIVVVSDVVGQRLLSTPYELGVQQVRLFDEACVGKTTHIAKGGGMAPIVEMKDNIALLNNCGIPAHIGQCDGFLKGRMFAERTRSTQIAGKGFQELNYLEESEVEL